jgi:hypothetical protein
VADSVLRNTNGQFTSERALKDGRVCGKRQPDAVIEARRQRLYSKQLTGKGGIVCGCGLIQFVADIGIIVDFHTFGKCVFVYYAR